jgi:endonuclease III
MKEINIHKIYEKLKEQFENYPSPVVDLIEIQTKDPFKILITTILSARTKDKTTREAAKKLFEKVDTVYDLEKLSEVEIEKLIYPVGFYKNKAKSLSKLPKILINDFDGKVPDEIDDLIKLPGVGRKTANLVRAIAFKKPAICVDVHVHRICNRLGYVNTKTPFETEMALREKLPEYMWLNFNSYLVAYGQNLCFPVNPRCDKCVIYDECNRIGVKTKYPKNV